MRLDRFLTEMGVGSRSDVKKLIAKGHVSVNGEICRDPAEKIDETADEVVCGGTRILFEQFVYFMLNKPQGVISESRRRVKPDEAGDISCRGSKTDDISMSKDETGRRHTLTCIDLIHEEAHRDLFPVGRLDKDTEGLLLITDDGQLAHELLSPKKHVDKVYYVELEKPLSETDRAKVESGVDIGDDTPTLPAKIVMLPEMPAGVLTDHALGDVPEMRSCRFLKITIHEGRFHQIKRMFEAVDNKVTFLKRLKMGNLSLDPALAPGEYRRLTQEELEELRSGHTASLSK